MPITGATDPSAALLQRMGPAASPGGMPPGAGGGPGGLPPGPPQSFAGNAGGGQQGPQMTPQMMQLAQLAQRMLMQQQGTQYVQQFLRQLAMQVKSVLSSQFMQNPKAVSHLGKAMDSMQKAIGEIASGTPTMGGDIQNSIMSLVKPAVQPGGNPGAPNARMGPGSMAA